MSGTRSWEREQIASLRSGDQATWERFVAEFGPPMHRYFRNAGSAEQAEDLLAEAFCAIVSQLPNFRGDSQLGTWVFAICRNKLYRSLGLKRRWQDLLHRAIPLLPPMAPEDPETAFLRQDAIATVSKAMATLPTIYREVLTLRHIEELPIKEVAAILGVSESQVKNLSRAGKGKLFHQMTKAPQPPAWKPQAPDGDSEAARERSAS